MVYDTLKEGNMMKKALQMVLGKGKWGRGPDMFREFFRDWTCNTWASGKVGNKRRSDLTKYFNEFVKARYLTPQYKITWKGKRSGTFFRANLNAFFDCCKEEPKIKFDIAEKKFLKFYFDIEENRNVNDNINVIDFIKNKVIELTLIFYKNETTVPGDINPSFFQIETLKGFKSQKMDYLIKKSNAQEFINYVATWKECPYRYFLAYYVKRNIPQLFEKTFLLIPDVYRGFIKSQNFMFYPE
jgi:hypothetical protein